MKLYLPDTNIFIYAYHGEEPYASHLTAWVEEKALGISSIVAAEFLTGAEIEEQNRFEALLDKFGALPVDTAVARMGADYRRSFLQKKIRIKLPDCLIAATAKFYQATLVTFDLTDFPMQDIKKIEL